MNPAASLVTSASKTENGELAGRHQAKWVPEKQQSREEPSLEALQISQQATNKQQVLLQASAAMEVEEEVEEDSLVKTEANCQRAHSSIEKNENGSHLNSGDHVCDNLTSIAKLDSKQATREQVILANEVELTSINLQINRIKQASDNIEALNEEIDINKPTQINQNCRNISTATLKPADLEDDAIDLAPASTEAQESDNESSGGRSNMAIAKLQQLQSSLRPTENNNNYYSISKITSEGVTSSSNIYSNSNININSDSDYTKVSSSDSDCDTIASKDTGDFSSNKMATSLRDSEQYATNAHKPTLKRKVSVFSHDGFPNIQLLDQQNIIARSSNSPSKTIIEQPTPLSQNQSSCKDHQSPEAQMAPVACIDVTNCHESTSASSTGRRSVRSDTLGSTGSSRASSCDEPTMTEHRKNSTVTNSLSSTSSLDLISNQIGSLNELQEGINLEESQTKANFDDIQIQNCRDQSQQQPQLQQQQPPPFKSIKTQLKRNSIPNAQLIQRHIDNLISQNEAIIDNWSFVGIRSYNSTRDCNSSSGANLSNKRSSNDTPLQSTSIAAQTISRPMKRWSTTTYGVVQSQQQKSPINSNSSIDLNDSCSGNNTNQSSSIQARLITERKRSYNLNRRLPLVTNRIDTSIENRTQNLKPPSNQNDTSNDQINSISANNRINLIQQQTLDIIAPANSSSSTDISVSVPSSPRSLTTHHQNSSSLIDFQRLLSQAQLNDLEKPSANHQTDQPQIQIENAIQNLSLKRNVNDDKQLPPRCNRPTPQQQHHHLQNQHRRHHSQQLHDPNAISEDLITSYDQLERQLSQNLILNHQHHQQQLHQDNEQLVIAAMLMERHKQLIAEHQINSLNESNTNNAILCPQRHDHLQHHFHHHHHHHHNRPMIEPSQQQQIDELRLAASMKHQVDPLLAAFPYNKLHPAQNHSLAFGAASASLVGINNAELLAPLAEGLGQTVASSASQSESTGLCDNRLLNDILSKMMSNKEELCQQASISQQTTLLCNHLNYSRELLTQSLDRGTPAHNCEGCGSSFWTQDLLDYHQMTQCSTRLQACQLRQAPLLTFNLTPSPSASNGTTSTLITANNHRASLINGQFHNIISKSVSPPRNSIGATNDQSYSTGLLMNTNLTMNLGSNNHNLNQIESQQQHLPKNGQLNDVSILKLQLLTTQTNSTQSHDNLPLKKRKISEPNMRY